MADFSMASSPELHENMSLKIVLYTISWTNLTQQVSKLVSQQHKCKINCEVL